MGDKLGGTELFWEDAVVIAFYFVMVLGVGIWSSVRSKRNSVSGYFLASRSMHWIPDERYRAGGGDTSDYVIELRDEIMIQDKIFRCRLRNDWSASTFLGTIGAAAGTNSSFWRQYHVIELRDETGAKLKVGASLFASNIGSGHFIGLSGSGASSGIAVAGFELNAMFVVLILGWFFVPVYMASGVYTMPEYLRKRFGGQRIRLYLSVLALLLYVFTKISADLYAGAIFINQSIKLEMYSSVLVILAVAGLFTIAGGLSAVIWTDFAQTILMLLGALYLSILSFTKVGGYSQLVENFKNVSIDESYVGYNSLNESCSQVPDDYMSLLKPPSDSNYPATGMIIGLTISAVWYWCSDQVIVQRVLSAKDLSHAKGGCILAGYLKILPLFLIIFPGMASRILFPNQIACSNPDMCEKVCSNKLGCTDIAYPKMVLELMPAGARGLMISVMLAALMSSLTSIFNSSSTIFTMDIWRRIRKQSSDTELLIVGRIFVLILAAVSIIWIPVIQAAQNSQLFHYIQSVTSYLAPPVCAVYVLAIVYKRVNEQGAFWGLMAGLVVGMIRFIWEFSYTVPSCASGLPDPRPYIISKVHYLHFGILLFILSSIVTIVVSLLTQPIGKMHLYRLTFWNRHSKDVRIEITKKQQPDIHQNGAHLGTVNVAFDDNDSKNIPRNEENNQSNGASMNVVIQDTPKKFIEPKSVSTEVTDTSENPLWKKAIYFICGISKDKTQAETEPQTSPEEEAYHAAEGILERPLWNRICNANAILLLVVGSFIWGYYA